MNCLPKSVCVAWRESSELGTHIGRIPWRQFPLDLLRAAVDACGDQAEVGAPT